MARSKKVSAPAVVTAAPAPEALSVSATIARIAAATVKAVSRPDPLPILGAAPVAPATGLILPSGVVPVAAPATVAAPVAAAASATPRNVAYVLSALAGGPLTVAALAEGGAVTQGAIRNAIDNIRRARGKGAIVALGGSRFGLPG